MRLFLAQIISLAFTWSASAQWAYQEQDASAFSDEKLHMILSIKDERGLGVRCQNGSNELIFMLPEKIEQIDAINALKPTILFRVDRNEPYELSVLAHDSDGTLLLMAEAERSLVEEIRDAKNRVAVVVNFFGKQLAETRYSARGSTNAATKLLDNCYSESAD